MSKILRTLMAFDGLAAAEEMTGNSYKTDYDTQALGMILTMGVSQFKNAALKREFDTTLSNTLEYYTSVIEDIGFEKVFELPFIYKPKYDNVERPETFFMYAHRELGILMCFDTYQTVNVNGGNYYYCWKANDDDDTAGCSSSGHYVKESDGTYFWTGGHDCREGIRNQINYMKSKVTFLNPWPAMTENDRPFLWPLHCGDSMEGDDYKAIRDERLALLPDWVKTMIGVT